MSRGKEEEDDGDGGGERHRGREVSGIVSPIRWLGHAGRPEMSEASLALHWSLSFAFCFRFFCFLCFFSLSTCFTMKSTAFKRF